MSISDFIQDLENKDIHLLLNDEQLKINAPKGALNEDLINIIKQNRNEIIKELKLKEELAATLISMDAPFFRFNRNAEKKIYCFPTIIGFGVWCSRLEYYLKDFSLISFNYKKNEDLPAYYADLIMKDSPYSDITILTYSAGGRIAIEVTKVLESRNVNVSDLVLVDVNKTIKQFATKEDVEAQGVFETLKQYNLEHLKERVYSVIYDYMNYTRSTILEGTIKANIHHVVAEHEDRDLAFLTLGKYKEYMGFGGIHNRMLIPPFLKDNAELINSILLEL